MKGFVIGAIVGTVVTMSVCGFAIGQAHADIVQTNPVDLVVPCKMNMQEGRIVLDGTFLPKITLEYYVVKYQPLSIQDGWSQGQCDVMVKQGITY